MKMQDAFWLANHIQANVPGVKVTAVGPFLPHEQITAASEWKVGAIGEGMERPWILKTEAELAMLVSAMHKLAPKPEGMLF
ncbi:hypothetical protein [Allorhodopirellula heiligendammensis]|uniref:Uncharacterized protein n=1 Tax=Allorhodopirellula heiligendammensis TaxID=2714739 RepID=A0A5C6BSW8_9BACT|nr:hypothetical protein [Allorhodopirellula heiligendammensis]TWU15055.1 hypothetical protein Poly21_22460 [Allorhodopirellula heiligendammensis]